jgi:hypothetical protein
MRKVLPPLVLFFLSPAIGELLSGSSPPVEFFTPPVIIILCVLYGGGAIMVREAVIRWHKGWPGLLALGAAYGIIEEGLIVKSFFDPAWQDIGILGSYGRWAGVNWVWSLELTVYHAVISIAIPILLTELLFPAVRHDSWVGKKLLIVIGVLFVLDGVVGYFFLTKYRPGPVQYWLAFAVVVALVLIARRLPPGLFPPKIIVEKKPVWFWLIGFLATVAFFIIAWALPNVIPAPPVVILLLVCLVILVFWLVLRLSGNGASWRDTHHLALAAGALTVFILISFVQELTNETRADNTAGMAVVGLVALFFLVWLYWKTRKRLREEADG